MSEYQYYEFQAVDRPLGELQQQELRALSTRARITATSFVNSYEWGNFKGSPARLMDRYFDLHVYLANWGTRCFSLRLPKKLVNGQLLDAFLGEVEIAEIRAMGDNLIVDISRDEIEPSDWDDGSGWLAALAPLRADILSGDLRLFYLLWLTAVEADVFEADEPEPMPGIGPLTAGLTAFAEFFRIDEDLVAAAAERLPCRTECDRTPGDIEAAIRTLPEDEQVEFLLRLHDGDCHVAVELRARIRQRLGATADVTPVIARTVDELRVRAGSICRERKSVADAKAAAERQLREKEQAEARRSRLEALAKRGVDAWREVEAEINRRNAGSYERAAELLVDLRAVAAARDALGDFGQRLVAICQRHAKKERFLERLRSRGLARVEADRDRRSR